MGRIEILGEGEQSVGAPAGLGRWATALKGEAGLCSQAGVGDCNGVARRIPEQRFNGAASTFERPAAADAADLHPAQEEMARWNGPGGGGRASLPETSLPSLIGLLLVTHRLIPTVRLSSAEDAVPLAEALQKAGLPLLLIELTTRAALPAIASVRTALSDFTIGAAAVLSSGQIRDAMLAGARFGAGPAMHPGLLETAHSAGFPFLPGAMTPSDIELGIQSGFLCQSICPAAAMGGPPMVRALAEPYLHTSLLLVPMGGLRMADFQEYLTVPKVGAVAGGFVCEQALVEAGMWEDVEAQAVLCRQKAWAVLRTNRHAWPDEDRPRVGPEEMYH